MQSTRARFCNAVDDVYDNALRTRKRDGFLTEMLLAFDARMNLVGTVISTPPDADHDTLTGCSPSGTIVLDRPLLGHDMRPLLSRLGAVAAIYVSEQPGTSLVCTGAWPAEIVLHTRASSRGHEHDISLTATALPAERWLLPQIAP